MGCRSAPGFFVPTPARGRGCLVLSALSIGGAPPGGRFWARVKVRVTDLKIAIFGPGTFCTRGVRQRHPPQNPVPRAGGGGRKCLPACRPACRPIAPQQGDSNFLEKRSLVDTRTHHEAGRGRGRRGDRSLRTGRRYRGGGIATHTVGGGGIATKYPTGIRAQSSATEFSQMSNQVAGIKPTTTFHFLKPQW